MNVSCPECGQRGGLAVMGRKQLRARAADAGVSLLPLPAGRALTYWWCYLCSNGGAVMRVDAQGNVDQAGSPPGAQRRGRTAVHNP